MTDEQIVRALECCGNMKECKKECPLGDVGGIDKCIHTLMLDALELIKRQQAEIGRLKYLNKLLERDVFNAEMNLESVSYELELIKQEKKSVQAEAVREFAERLTEHSSFCVAKSDSKELYETKAYTIRAKIIDELVKEMTEEKK